MGSCFAVVSVDTLNDRDGGRLDDFVVDGAPVAPGLEQSVCPHEAEMLRAGAGGQVEGQSQLADGVLAFEESFDDLEPMRVREDAQGGGDALQRGDGRSFCLRTS